MSKIIPTVVCLAALALVAADKKEPDPEPPKTTPLGADVRGVIKSVKRGALTTYVLVVGKREKDTVYDQAVIYVPTNATFHRWQNGKKVAAKYGDIRVGSRIQCTFTGGVDKSKPVQATAKEVLFLDAPKAKK